MPSSPVFRVPCSTALSGAGYLFSSPSPSVPCSLLSSFSDPSHPCNPWPVFSPFPPPRHLLCSPRLRVLFLFTRQLPRKRLSPHQPPKPHPPPHPTTSFDAHRPPPVLDFLPPTSYPPPSVAVPRASRSAACTKAALACTDGSAHAERPPPGSAFLHRHIERRRRLVRDQQLRVARQRHRDHHALPHPARKLVRVLIHAALGVGIPTRSIASHRARTPSSPSRSSRLVQPHRLHDLLAHREDRVQARHRLLKDHRDLVAADVAGRSP
jgi:hypothetical protein